MKFLLLAVTALLSTSSSQACPELNGIDLANEESDAIVEEVSSEPIKISRYKFKKIDGFQNMSYTACKSHLEVTTLRMKDSGKTFKAIVSNHHECDGDNTYGGLLDANGKKVLGKIQDSQISCN